MKYKVGDKVRIVRTDYGDEGLAVGTIHPVSDVEGNMIFLRGSKGGDLAFFNIEIEPANILSPGNTYTDHKGQQWECIFVRDGKAWMTHGDETAYVWNADTGENISQGGGDYNIALPERRKGSVEYVYGVPVFDTWQED